VRGKFTGTRDLRKNTSRPSSGRSSALPSRTGDGAEETSYCTPLFSSVTCGRGASTVTGTFSCRPSCNCTLAT